MDSGELREGELRRIRQVMDIAFEGRFSDDDWDHALGGTQVIVEDGGDVLSHASVVPRTLRVGGRRVSTGYVEAVATGPPSQRRGFGTEVMSEVAQVIAERYELGALSTASPGFYTRLGWELWTGPTAVVSSAGLVPTPDDDGGILVLRPPTAKTLDLTATIVCEWREGDLW
ncbi:MAG: GNAT family N-acetyltransferase [Acidimicrobiia bacterium]|nr:GNAT family N-acetyltransferase [Acidimicrobiia bacterium]